MKYSSRLLRPCGLLLVAVLLTPAAQSATRTKANNNTNLNVAGSWDALPGVNDITRWNSTVTAVTAGSPFPLGGDVSWLGIQIVNPGAAVTITGAQTITLGGPGVNASSYPSGASIDMSTATQDLTISANLRLLANSGQVWNVQTGRVLTLNGTTFTRSTGATLNIVGAGTVAATNISNDATGLIGAWASQGTGTATRYATVSGGNIVAYTGGTAAATAAGVTAMNGTENYDVAAVTGSFGVGASINTLRYTGASGTIAGNLEVNGLMNAGAGTLTMSGDITIGASRELVANSTVGLTLSGTISDNAGGASGLTKSGNGTLTLSGNSDYTGATVISRGVLAITHANALGATGVGAGTTVYTAPGARLQLSNNITVNEEITFISGDPNSTNSTGLYNASGNNTLLGQLKPVDQLRMGGASGTLLNIRGGVTGTNTFFVLNPGGGTFSFTDQPVAIGASGSFYLDQSGTVILGVTGNTFGRTLVAGGTMRMAVAGALPSTMSKIEVGVGYSPNGTLDLDGYSQTAVELKSGSFRSPATRLITSATAAMLTINQPTNTTYDGRITGAVALTKSGTGTLTLQGDNAHTGDTVISGGALLIHNVAASGQTGNYSTTLNSANASVTGLSTANLVVGQAISGAGIPAGAFISGITNATTVSVTLPANAGATGTTSTAVTFAALGGSLAGSTVNYDNQGGLLRFGYSTTSTTLGGLKGDQNLSLLNTNAAPAGVALSVGANHQSTTYTGDLTGAGGALNKVGTGTLALGGANTYTGATTVTDGTLLIDGSLSGTSLVEVNGGTLGGIGTITGSIDVATGSALQGGDGITAADDLQIAGGVNLAGNAVIKLTLGAGLTHSTLARTSGAWVFGSDLAFTFADAGAEVGTYENLITGLTDSITGLGDIGTWTITNAGYAGTFSFDGANVDLTVTSVPEPGTVISLCGGLGLLLSLRRRRMKC